MDDVLRVTRSCVVPLSELRWRFETSGGPGGQHANRARTRVELSFDIAESPSLSPADRERLMAKLGDVVRVVADDHRSQARNRSLALDRLRSRLAEALRRERHRRPTTPSTASHERRLAGKRRRAELKRTRQNPAREDGPG